MKRFLSVLLAAWILAGLVCYGEENIAAQEFQTLFYNFENYTGGYMDGWIKAGNNASLEAYETGADYGTSMMMNTGAAMQYTLPIPVSSGIFAVSFDVQPMDQGQMFRIHLGSQSTGYEAHSIFALTKEGAIAAADTGRAWSFKKIAAYEPETWYRIDLLMDFNEQTVRYYVDSVYCASEQMKFFDISSIYLRTESGDVGAKVMVDNLRIGSLEAAMISSEYGTGLVPADVKTMKLMFDVSVAPESLSQIALFQMGENPIEMTPCEIPVQIVGVSNSSCTVGFPDGLNRGMVYKLDLSGVQTLWDGSYETKEIFFVTGGITGQKQVVDADFSTIDFQGALEPVHPPNDAEWRKGGTERVFPVYAEDLKPGQRIPVVRFQAYAGNSEYPDAYCTLQRQLEIPLSGKVVIECHMKIVKEQQEISALDSLGQKVTLIECRDSALYVPGEDLFVHEITQQWFRLTLELDLNQHTINVGYDGEPILTQASIAPVADFSILEFSQRNTEASWNNPDFSKEMRADSFLANCQISGEQELAGVTKVLFFRENGQQQTTQKPIAADSEMVQIFFSHNIAPGTLEGAVVLEKESGEERIVLNGQYDETRYMFQANIPNYLEGNSRYRMSVVDTVCTREGMDVKGIEGVLSVEPGECIVKSLSAMLSGETVNARAQVIHTDGQEAKMYLTVAGYRDGELVFFEFEPCTLEAAQRNAAVQVDFTVNQAQTMEDIRCFLWNDFSSQTPLTHYITVNGS